MFPSFLRRSRSRYAALDQPEDARHPDEKSWARWANARITLPSPESLTSWTRHTQRIPRPSKHTLLYRLFPLLLLMPTLLVLLYSFSHQPIQDSIRHKSPEAGASHSPHKPIDRIHADHLQPAHYNLQDTDVRKALVLASYSKQDVAWLKEVPDLWELYRYVLDDPNPVTGLTVPRNQGREAMAYLTFIIDHYDDLPDFTVFHHGDRTAWHQPEPTVMKIEALNLSALAHDHYINLRCAHKPGCTESSTIDLTETHEGDGRVQAQMLPKFWNTLFGNESIWDLGPPPTRLAIPCCAQFAVTREAIRARPLVFWKSYRRPLERDLEEYKPIWGPLTNSYFVGICYEKLWHMVFGKPQTYCPSEDYCRKVQFSDAVVCDRYTGPFEESQGWELIKCVNQWQDSA